MEVIEKIVEEYIKLVQGWFYMSDITFPTANHIGYRNIDFLAYDHRNDQYYDLEVKYTSLSKIVKKYPRDRDDLLFQLQRNERKEAIESIVGKSKNVTKIIVTTKSYFDSDDFSANYFASELNKSGYECKIWYFEDILPQLYEKITERGKYSSEITETIRLIKEYIKP